MSRDRRVLELCQRAEPCVRSRLDSPMRSIDTAWKAPDGHLHLCGGDDRFTGYSGYCWARTLRAGHVSFRAGILWKLSGEVTDGRCPNCEVHGSGQDVLPALPDPALGIPMHFTGQGVRSEVTLRLMGESSVMVEADVAGTLPALRSFGEASVDIAWRGSG